MPDDVDPKSTVQPSSSGLAEGNKKWPVTHYFKQTKNLVGNFHFLENLSTDPIVDVYGLNGRKIFVMFVPDEKDRKAAYQLDLSGATSAKVYMLFPGADRMEEKIVKTTRGSLNITLTEHLFL